MDNNNKIAGNEKKMGVMNGVYEELNEFLDTRFNGNPFQNGMKLLPNGRLLLNTCEQVCNKHVVSIITWLMSLNRNIHLNTGTHGMKDGSTVFFLTSDTKDYLNLTSEIVNAMVKKVGKLHKSQLGHQK